jgi:hypothetical protein
MGRRSWSDRLTVEECRFFGISDLTRAGVFKKGPGHFWTPRWTDSRGKEIEKIGCWLLGHRPDGLYLRLIYSITDYSTGEKKSLDYNVQLTTTPCNFGGFRYWFICPVSANGRFCGRQVGKLYLPGNGIYFACRHCYNLTYRSCKEHDKRISALMKLPLRRWTSIWSDLICLSTCIPPRLVYLTTTVCPFLTPFPCACLSRRYYLNHFKHWQAQKRGFVLSSLYLATC